MNINYKKLIIASGLICLAILVLYLSNALNAYAVNRVCSGGNCWYVACNSNSDCGTNGFTGGQYCQDNKIYQNYTTYTCNNWGSAYSSCTSSSTSQLQQTCSSNQMCSYGKCAVPTCTSHTNSKCVGNSLYWFNSCGKQEDLYKTCSQNQVCSNDTCVTNYLQTSYVQTGYNFHSLNGCFNNKVYWYDSLGNQQDVYQNCMATGQTCQNDQCIGQVSYRQPVSSQTYNQPASFQPVLIKHYSTSCYNNDVYWQDSRGFVQDIYKSCSDDNQCTQDSCQDAECQNTLKCDGSTCKITSNDYSKYCKDDKTEAVVGQSKGDKPNVTIAAVSKNLPILSFAKKWYVWLIIAAVFVFLFIIIFRNLSAKV